VSIGEVGENRHESEQISHQVKLRRVGGTNTFSDSRDSCVSRDPVRNILCCSQPITVIVISDDNDVIAKMEWSERRDSEKNQPKSQSVQCLQRHVSRPPSISFATIPFATEL